MPKPRDHFFHLRLGFIEQTQFCLVDGNTSIEYLPDTSPIKDRWFFHQFFRGFVEVKQSSIDGFYEGVVQLIEQFESNKTLSSHIERQS